MNRLLVFFTICFIWSANIIIAQDDLMNLLGDQPKTTDYSYATFKTTRIINSQSIENPAEGVLIFMIQHRFGRINTGIYEFFGLDQATTRLGIEYGITKRLCVGLGRSSFEKTYDGYLKYKILRQSIGARRMPFSMSYFVSTAINSLKWSDQGVENRTNYFSSRVSYTHQVLFARKFSNSISAQLIPSLIHKNLVPSGQDKNDIFSVGVGGRVKLTKRMSVNAEYFYTPTSQIAYDFNQPFSIGVDIETGGHVFQLHFSNAQAFFERGFITETNGSWWNGDIYFGFGISRVFTIIKPKTILE
jgi:hypothetical protein